MRLFCELFLAAVLIWLGWTKSFHDRIDQIRGIEPPPPTQRAEVRQSTTAPRQPFLPAYARTRPSATPTGDWMWDPAHRNTLDRPAYKTGNAQSTPSQSYWIDSRGVRHPSTGTPPPASTSPSP
jgi:hypothetical protein